jgi:adenine-specific DNA-methyltransferase
MSTPVTDFEHATATRKLLPPAGTPPGEKVKAEPKVRYAYDPHRTPVLRFNERINRCRELLDKATRTSLTKDEAAELAAYLESEQPWLEWAGKQEQPDFHVEPVALHIHERVSAQAILKTVRREDAQRDFFAQPTLSAKEARAWYQHDVAWANRLILGDSLQVMTSLARREGLSGQVQMIFFDPPYGIKFSSNWQNEVGKIKVENKDADLSREPEMIRAYRDTWTLGVHSYLAYIKQRLLTARELLTDSGSIFVQISDENLHRVRAVLDEVFGAENFCSEVTFKKTTSATSELLASTSDYLLWYAKDAERVKYRQLYHTKEVGGDGGDAYGKVELIINPAQRKNIKQHTELSLR